MWRHVWRSHSKEHGKDSPKHSVASRGSSERQLRIAEELKTEGNALFQKGKYKAAAEKYTEAITIRPDWAVVFVNRANCHKKLNDWSQMERDCRTAISIDNQSMKGHYFLGLALEARQQHATALEHLEKSYELARNKGERIMDEIGRTIARVRYTQWQRQAEERQDQDQALLTRLIAALSATHQQELHTAVNPVQLQAAHSADMKALQNVFERATAADQPQQLPECFTCPITMNIYRDPVVSPSGFSFERSDLLEHMRKNGPFDPITRQSISESQLARNISLHSAIQLFLKQHPWAWEDRM